MIDLNDASAQSETSPIRHVPWRAVKDAVRGREMEILAALGIAWPASETHITCPYPEHIDRHPSWRWDAAEGKAHCSCDSSASIFDVIMKVRDVDFASACVIAAEIIGRDDLIGADNDNTAGLTLEEYAVAKRLPAEWLQQIGVREVAAYGPAKSPAVRTEYRRPNGGQPSVRFRVNLNGDKKKRHFWRKGDKACLYGGDWAGGLPAAGFVILAEGESDTQTLWHNGFPALGLPGANTWNEERDAPLFDSVPVIYVVIEPDTGGGEVMKWLSRSRIAPRARLIRLPPDTKDPSALYLAAPERFVEAFQAVMAAALPLPPVITAATRRPIVRIVGGDLPTIIDEAENILVANDPSLYQRGDLIVRPAPAVIPIADDRKIVGLRLVPVKPLHMAERLTHWVDFQRFDGRSRKWLSIDCPPKFAATYLERVGAWRLRSLTGFTVSPTLRSDGSILDRPGWDRQSGILYAPGGIDYPPIPLHPTRDDAIRALARLKSLIVEFPFTSDAGRSVSLSGMLTTPIRRSLPSAPLHAFDAPVAGSGKTKLTDIASMLASGHEVPVISQGANKEELEKRLGAVLLAGDAAINIDNCEEALSSSFLCQCLTQPIVKARILGTSQTPTVASNATFFATGNNLVIVGDLTRRAVKAQLDPRCERPELRVFENPDPILTLKHEWPEYLVAALTVLRAFDVAGRPSTGTPPGSFEVWWGWVRGALVWLDEADPCDTIANIRAEDPRLMSLAALLQQWHKVIGSDAVTVKHVIDRATDPVPQQGIDLNPSRREYIHPEFRDALLNIAGHGSFVNEKRLGKYLSREKLRIVNGLYIAQGDAVRTWRVLSQ